MTNKLRDFVVVDDDLVLLSVLSELLKENHYAVRTASDGFAALAVIRDRVPDVLLSDLNMPRMTGFELLSVVRRATRSAHTPRPHAATSALPSM